MSDVTLTCLDLPCGDKASGEPDRKLAGFDIGMMASASLGLMVAARLLNVVAAGM